MRMHLQVGFLTMKKFETENTVFEAPFISQENREN